MGSVGMILARFGFPWMVGVIRAKVIAGGSFTEGILGGGAP